jgi:transcriptional antiterminator RfaH
VGKVENQGNWYALYTRPRNEKKVVERLEKQGFEVYLPLQEQKRKWSDRYKVVKVPIISSYVFIRTEEKYREQVLQDHAISNFVFWLGKPAIIRDVEIERIKILLNEASADDAFYFSSLEPGDKAKISAGNFAGKSGLIVSANKKEFSIILDGLGLKLVLSKMQVEKEDK